MNINDEVWRILVTDYDQQDFYLAKEDEGEEILDFPSEAEADFYIAKYKKQLTHKVYKPVLWAVSAAKHGEAKARINELEHSAWEGDEIREMLSDDNEALRAAVRLVVTQKADDVCWLDAYRELAALVGVEYDPELLPREKFLGNCAHYYDCLAKGEPYKTPKN